MTRFSFSFYTMPGRIVCEPFPSNVVETKVSHGFAQAQQKVEATGLRVLCGNKEIPSGMTVYVAGEMCKSVWGKDVRDCDTLGSRFIVVPIDAVLFVERPETE